MGIKCCNSRQSSTNILSCGTASLELLEKEQEKIEQVAISPMKAFETHRGLSKGKIIGPYGIAKSILIGTDREQTYFSQKSQQVIDNQKRLNAKLPMVIRNVKTSFDVKGEDVKSPGTVSSVKPIMRVNSGQLKVAPSHFRCEKAGKLEDRYQILSLIGKGGYGEVKKIRDIETNEIRALKIMLKSHSQMTKNFSDEIRILQKLVSYRIKNG